MTMKIRTLFALVFLFLAAFAVLPSEASTTSVTTTLKVVVDLRDEIRVLHSNLHLDPWDGTEENRTHFRYRLAVYGPARRKVTARLADPLPPGVTLSLELSAPGTGRSKGPRTLSEKPVILLKDLAELGFHEGEGILRFRAETISPVGEGFSRIILEIMEQ